MYFLFQKQLASYNSKENQAIYDEIIGPYFSTKLKLVREDVRHIGWNVRHSSDFVEGFFSKVVETQYQAEFISPIRSKCQILLP